MPEPRLSRRLAAVLAMDIAGYSRLMGMDEEGTHARWHAMVRTVIEPAVAAGDGRVVKRTGDGLLLEFASVVNALRSAARFQAEAARAEAAYAEDRRIRLRMGINLGDIIVEADDIFGDDVNIAARLEAMAGPGEVLVSEEAAMGSKHAGLRFVDLGLHRLKNIARPVRVLRVALADSDAGSAREITALGVPRIAGFGDRPAIAVLPFRHLGGGIELEQFSDSLTEDVITRLSRTRSFPVLSRNSVFAFKGQDMLVKAVGFQLGARYVIEGGVRRMGDRTRANVQLIDTDSGDDLLTEQYEHSAQNLFLIHDEIVSGIVGTLEPELLKAERLRAIRAPTENATAYQAYQRGMWHHYRYTPADGAQARAFFSHAIALDPTYAQAEAALAIALSHSVYAGWEPDREGTYARAMMHARNAVRTDPRDPQAHFALGLVLSNTGDVHGANEAFCEAVRYNPSHVAANANLGLTFNHMNRPAEAMVPVMRALELSRSDPRRFIWLPYLVITHYLEGRYRDALAVAQEAVAAAPDIRFILRYLVATLGKLDRVDAAAPLVVRLRSLDGGLDGTLAYLGRFYVPAALAELADGLRRAGLR